ncbi:MAG TPA: nucleotidyltransferase family protein [Actinomycetota bacterium]|nr:nucleotidyltransferase family protein [Actinomycetota bacterium]
MKAIVLCAGLGTRLRPLTDTVPKVMVEIGGEPLLFRQLRMLREVGVTQVAMNLHWLGDVIREAVGDGSRFGIEARYGDEPELRGSAGALNGFPGFFDERFFVVYGDVYYEMDLAALADFHAARGAAFTIATAVADDPTRCGVLRIAPDARVEAFVEKPPSAPPDAPTNTGVYVCEPRIAALIPPGMSDFGADVIPSLIASGENVYAFSASAIVQDIGTPQGLERARRLASRA